MRTSAIFEEGWKVIDQTKNSARSKKNLEKKKQKSKQRILVVNPIPKQRQKILSLNVYTPFIASS